MTRRTCIGHLTGKVPDTPGPVRFRWVVDVPDPDCRATHEGTA